MGNKTGVLVKDEFNWLYLGNFKIPESDFYYLNIVSQHLILF